MPDRPPRHDEDVTGFDHYSLPLGSSPAYAELVIETAVEETGRNLGLGRADRRQARFRARQRVRNAAAQGGHRIEQDNLATEEGNNILRSLRSRL